MNKSFSQTVSRILIIDARYGYEFKGGHIRGAVNIPSEGFEGRHKTEEKIMQYFEKIDKFNVEKRRIAIFHCEFSSERGPNMYQIFRKLDRKRNTYPKLDWPEIYLLKGGYKEFWENFRHDPSLFGNHGYTAMLDNEQELNKVRKLRRKAQTAPGCFTKNK